MGRSDISQPNDWDAYRQRTAAFAAGRNVGAVSGVGSTARAAKPLVKWLLAWLASHPDVHSMVEASCGHWPSGWQGSVRWPFVDYVGIDVVREQVDANAAFVAKRGVTLFGLRSAAFLHGNMTKDALPAADLLVTKDTLIHFRHADIIRFLRLSVVGMCPPLFKYVIFVQEQPFDLTATNNLELGRNGHHPLDFSLPPFSLDVRTVFTYASGRCCKKSVQLLDLTHACQNNVTRHNSSV